ncbi:hypothetical protein CYMTET_47159 [Cymbomonas tetramitiformis]|uniref:ethanolamine kinase n=1 Tax=Cymbomonas tetramitiformis TaxID=36881 RepID=A0AAE0EWU8_9CHLO|nr:hypothetical protein CYMTET_47159 [Cymbomonas tetramitiformis]|eukprot:gene21255-25541_t
MPLEWKPLASVPELAGLLGQSGLEGSSVSFLKHVKAVTIVTGGLTNRMYGCELSQDEGKISEEAKTKWIVRVSGENVDVHFIDRTREFHCLGMAYEAELTPKAYYDAECGLFVQTFIEDAHTFDNADVAANVPACVRLFFWLHQQHPSKYPKFVFNAFEISRHYLKVARGHGAPLPPNFDESLSILNDIEVAMAEGSLSKIALVPCHNDLLAANWVTGSVGGAASKLWLIDFEYAALGDRFFDLANFAVNCELSKELEQEMLDVYFGEGGWGDQHMARMKLFKCVSDMRESLWSFVQWGVSKTSTQEFFEEYGNTCLARFQKSTGSDEFAKWMSDVTKELNQ